jgi:hypothetical protein
MLGIYLPRTLEVAECEVERQACHTVDLSSVSFTKVDLLFEI